MVVSLHIWYDSWTQRLTSQKDKLSEHSPTTHTHTPTNIPWRAGGRLSWWTSSFGKWTSGGHRAISIAALGSYCAAVMKTLYRGAVSWAGQLSLCRGSQTILFMTLWISGRSFSTHYPLWSNVTRCFTTAEQESPSFQLPLSFQTPTAGP